MRRATVALVLSTLVSLALAAPASATTGHVNWLTLGEGATATWTDVPTEPEEGVTYTDTFLAVFHEVSTPQAGGHFEAAFFLQSAYHFDGGELVLDWNASAFGSASVQVRQPIAGATASGTVTLTTCTAEGDCADSPLAFSAEWAGDGAVARQPKLPDVTVTPGMSVYLTFGNGDTFVRPATATLEPASLLPAGSHLVPTSAEQEGTKLFVAHFAAISICHDGIPDVYSPDLPVPCIPNP
jgi:hypothetical protein